MVEKTDFPDILREKHDGRFILKVKFPSELLSHVEPSHKWILTNINYQEP